MKLNRLAADVNPDNPWRDAGEDFPGDGACFGGDLIDTDVGAEDFDFVVDRDLGVVGHVDHDLIHRHAPEDGMTVPLDPYLRALA